MKAWSQLHTWWDMVGSFSMNWGSNQPNWLQWFGGGVPIISIIGIGSKHSIHESVNVDIGFIIHHEAFLGVWTA